MIYLNPGHPGSKVNFKPRYENFIGGKWVPPVKGQYFDNATPITGKPFCKIPRSSAEDIELALDAAHAAKDGWANTPVAQRARILNQIADRMEANLEMLAVAETWDNGKPVRETLAADIPLAIDHFRYFAGCIRAQEGTLGELDPTTVSYQFHEPLGVVGQIIPWNFPLLMAAWKVAPAQARAPAVRSWPPAPQRAFAPASAWPSCRAGARAPPKPRLALASPHRKMRAVQALAP
jgi:aldehyde dehydrogenase